MADDLPLRPDNAPPPTPTTLVIGYGNDLRSDDGAGIRAATRLAEQAARPNQPLPLRVIVTRQLTPDLADGIATAARVFFVDAYAARAHDAGLRVDRIGCGDAREPSAIGHHGDPAGLMSLTDRLYRKRPDAWVVGIPAFTFDAGETISPATARRIDEAVDLIEVRAVSAVRNGERKGDPG